MYPPKVDLRGIGEENEMAIGEMERRQKGEAWDISPPRQNSRLTQEERMTKFQTIRGVDGKDQ